MSAMFIVMTIDTEVLPVASVRGVVFVVAVFVVNRQFMHIPIRELSGATGAYPGMNLERLFAIAFFFLGLILAGPGQKLTYLVGFAFSCLRLIRTEASSHGFFLPQVKGKNQMLTTLSANCMAVTISNIFVVSPTTFFSSRLKWVRQVPQTRM